MIKKLLADLIEFVKKHEKRVRFSLKCLGVLLYFITVTLLYVYVIPIRQDQRIASLNVFVTRTSASLTQWSKPPVIERLYKINIRFSEDVGNPLTCEQTRLSLKWAGPQAAALDIEPIETPDGIDCQEHSVAAADTVHITSCLSLRGAQLYGGSITGEQHWPSQNNVQNDSAYVTGMSGNGGVVEAYWLTSAGLAVFVPAEVPLFVSQNKTKLCLTSKIQDPYLPDATHRVNLTYYICSGRDPVAVHSYATRRFLRLPRQAPDKRMIQHPIWSTWARYKKLIDSQTVLGFADQILHHGFNNSQLEIDDNWETCYGSAQFFPQTFPDTKSMVAALKSKGFRVTLWTHPFINLFCPAHDVAQENGYLAVSRSGSTLMSWWDGLAGIVNFTNPAAAAWWSQRLQLLADQIGVDAFKFDAGEANYLPGAPEVAQLNAPLRLQPNIFTTVYVRTVANTSKLNLAEVRVVFRNQEEPIFVRMGDKDSAWGIDNGLKSLVTTLLAMNMVGYSFVLPDMVGGNGYSQHPSKELFIRWLQANTFMPSVQFSYVPWDFDEETVQISKKFTALHYQYSDKIYDLALKKVKDGSPINPPVWWIDPSDKVAQTIDSEFLLGDDLLVAPVLDKGAMSRDIYLPRGKWRDELHPSVILNGKKWLRNYTVELDELAYFTRVQ